MAVLLITLAFIALVARNGFFGPLVVGAVWLAAAAFNPSFNSATVWFIAFVAAYIVDYESEGV